MADPSQVPQWHKAPSPVREAHPSDAPLPFPTIRVKLGPRIDEALEYNSCEDLVNAFQSHCAPHGYCIAYVTQNKPKKGVVRLYNCDRGGKPRNTKNPDTHSTKKRANTGSRKINCPFRIDAYELYSGRWKIEYKEECHNHEASHGEASHPGHRIKSVEVNKSAQGILNTLMLRRTKIAIIKAEMKEDWGITLTSRDIYNMRARLRTEELGGLTPIQWLAQELQKRDFFVDIETDKDNRAIRVFEISHYLNMKLLTCHQVPHLHVLRQILLHQSVHDSKPAQKSLQKKLLPLNNLLPLFPLLTFNNHSSQAYLQRHWA